MKTIFYCITIFNLLFFSHNSFAANYSSQQIERYVNKTPRKAENNINTLVKYLTDPFDDDLDKAKAIAFWIASRIQSDEYLYNNNTTTRLIKNYNGQTSQELLKSRVGICGDYALLFKDMCYKAGIRAKIVHGYAYPTSKRLSSKEKQNSGHAWNVFKYKSRNIYVDTTFMAKGATGVSSNYISNYTRQRALNKIKKENKLRSNISGVNDYYFDFDYKKEIKEKKYKHEER